MCFSVPVTKEAPVLLYDAPIKELIHLEELCSCITSHSLKACRGFYLASFLHLTSSSLFTGKPYLTSLTLRWSDLTTLNNWRKLVPMAFVAKLRKPFPETTILQRQSGRSWPVKVVKHDNEVYFQEGWREFVQENDIEIGDFLVFSYDGNSTVDVTIIGKSMCEKGEKFVNIQKGEVEDNDADFDGSDDPDEEVEQVEDEDGGGEEEIDEYSDDEEDTDYCANDSEEEEDLRRKTRKRKTKEAEIGESSKSNFVAEEHISTSNPYFVPKLHSRYRHLHLPINILKDFKVKLCRKIKFHDPNGRKWDGHVSIQKDGRILIRGWNVVCRCNHIKKGDHCICELLPGKRSTCHAIKVHIV